VFCKPGIETMLADRRAWDVRYGRSAWAASRTTGSAVKATTTGTAPTPDGPLVLSAGQARAAGRFAQRGRLDRLGLGAGLVWLNHAKVK